MRRLATPLHLTATLLVTAAPLAAQQNLPFVSEAQYERWLTELYNWGRWGPDDEILVRVAQSKS